MRLAQIASYGRGGGYSEESQAVFDLMPDELSTSEKNMISGFVNSQVASGNWANIGSFIYHGLSSRNNALVNWKGGNNAAEVGTPGFDSSYGFRCNGTDTIDINYPITNALFAQNNAFFGGFLKTKRTADSSASYFIATSASTNNLIAQISGDPTSRVNTGTSLAKVESVGLKSDTFYLAQRTASTGQSLHIKTVAQSLETLSDAATSVSIAAGAEDFTYCKNHLGGGLLDADVLAFVAGSGGIDANNFLSNFETFFFDINWIVQGGTWDDNGYWLDESTWSD